MHLKMTSSPLCVLCCYQFEGIVDGQPISEKEALEATQLLTHFGVTFNSEEVGQGGGGSELKSVICPDCWNGLEGLVKCEQEQESQQETVKQLERQLEEAKRSLEEIDGEVTRKRSKLSADLLGGDEACLRNKVDNGEYGNLNLEVYRVRQQLLKVAEKWRDGQKNGQVSKPLASGMDKSLSSTSSSLTLFEEISPGSSKKGNQSGWRDKVEDEVGGKAKEKKAEPPKRSPKKSPLGGISSSSSSPAKRQSQRTANVAIAGTSKKPPKDLKLRQRPFVKLLRLTSEEIAQEKEKLKKKPEKPVTKVIYFGDTSDESEEESSLSDSEESSGSGYSTDRSADSFVTYIRGESGLTPWSQKVVAGLYGKQQFQQKQEGVDNGGKKTLDFDKKTKRLTYAKIPIILLEKEECLKCGKCRATRAFKTSRRPENYWREITEHIQTMHLDQGAASSVLGGGMMEDKARDSWDEDDGWNDDDDGKKKGEDKQDKKEGDPGDDDELMDI